MTSPMTTRKVSNDTWMMFAVLGAIVMVFVAGVYVPQMRHMARLKDQINRDKAEIARDADAVALVPPLVRAVRELRTLYKDYDRRLPKEVDVGAFYKDISSGFKNERLTRPYMAIQSPVREELYTTLPIRLETEGSYLGVARLLQRLDEMERLTHVEQLELKALPKGRTGDIEVTMLVNIYHQPGGTEVGKDEPRKP